MKIKNLGGNKMDIRDIFTHFEIDWIIELVEKEYSEQLKTGFIYEDDEEAFKNILKILKENHIKY